MRKEKFEKIEKMIDMYEAERIACSDDFSVCDVVCSDDSQMFYLMKNLLEFVKEIRVTKCEDGYYLTIYL